MIRFFNKLWRSLTSNNIISQDTIKENSIDNFVNPDTKKKTILLIAL